jgi:hypothetical protein
MYDDEVHALIQRRLQHYLEVLELACERMLVSDRGGVLAVSYPDGSFRVSLDPSVPWGTIHEHREFDNAPA